jgi:hypothetical protein
MRVLTDAREWSPDRLHLAPDGHRRVALRACEVMGVPVTRELAGAAAGPAGSRRLARPQLLPLP